MRGGMRARRASVVICAVVGHDAASNKRMAMRYTQVVNPSTKRGRPPGHRCDPSHLWDCAACGKSFHRPACWRSRTNTGRYCSNGCRLAELNKLPKWNVGKRTSYATPKGYLRVWDGNRLRMEHVIVMEAWIGRPLLPRERVHHLDGDRAHNARSNLVLFASQRDHVRAMHPDLAENIGRGQPPSMSKQAVVRRERRAAERYELAAIPLPAGYFDRMRAAVPADDLLAG